MSRRRGPKGPDIRDVKPTIILLDAKLTVNGGSLSNPEIARVWHAIAKALHESAFANGLGYSWTGEFSCTTPQRMQARIERHGLNVEMPPSDPAIGKSVEPTQTIGSAKESFSDRTS